MFKDNTLQFTFNDWKAGISSSAFSGIGEMRNLDPFSKVGSLKVGKKGIDIAPAAADDFAKHAVFDSENAILYVGLAGDGKLLSRSSGGTWSTLDTVSGDCHGLNVWKGYVLYASETHLNAFRITSPFYFDNWQSFEEGKRGLLDLPHQILVGVDDVVYVTDGKYIASLQEIPGQTFDADNASTFTWNAEALDLPDGYVASCLSEYGQYLIIGSYNSATLNRGNEANIYPWDKISASFGIPLRAKGNGVWQTISHNNRIYSLLDVNTGRIVETNLSSYRVLEELHLIEGGLTLHPDAVEIMLNEIMFGIGANSTNTTNCGVYGFKFNQSNGVDAGLLHLKSTVSGGTTGTQIGSVVDTGEGDYVVTWENNNEYGIDLFSDTLQDAYGAYITTQQYIVGSKANPKQFKDIQIQLGKKLATGEGVKVWYRESQGDAWSDLFTFDFATYGAVSAVHDNVEIIDLSTVQLKVGLTAESTTSPEFLSLTIR